LFDPLALLLLLLELVALTRGSRSPASLSEHSDVVTLLCVVELDSLKEASVERSPLLLAANESLWSRIGGGGGNMSSQSSGCNALIVD
jgi:hypothetical protein